MVGLGVLVEYSAYAEDSFKNGLSCSGIYISSGWILTHGTVVIDLLKSSEAESFLEELKIKGCAVNYGTSPLCSIVDNTKSKFRVIFDEKNYKNLISTDFPHVEPEVGTLTHTKLVQKHDPSYYGKEIESRCQLPVSSSETASYLSHPASLFMVFIQPGIIKSLSDLMPASQGWKLTEEKGESEPYEDLEAITVSSFALLRVSSFIDGNDKAVFEKPIEDLMCIIEKVLTVTEYVCKGTDVYIESSPFGSLSPSVFLNSLSKGIISNVSGSEEDVYLTDARCVMGAEGAPVYAAVHGKVKLCGMVISPFCWKNGEWLGVSLLAAIKPVLFSLLRSLKQIDNNGTDDVKHVKKEELSTTNIVNRSTSFYDRSNLKPPQDMVYYTSFRDAAKTLDDVVVGVLCGGGWGSGIVICASPGIILTCAHVVQPAKCGEVAVITSDGTHIKGQVIYQSYPSCMPQYGTKNNGKERACIWDLAVVLTSSLFPYALPLAAELPPKGSPVLVAGHGVFSPNCLPSATLSVGVISKVVSADISNLSYSTIIGDKQDISSLCKHGPPVEKMIVHDNIKTFHDKYQDTLYRKSDVSLDLISSDSNGNSVPDVDDKGQNFSRPLLLGSDNNNMVPVMLQTSCSVYAGNSGGPVVINHPHHGLQVAGVMVCNIKDLANKATFPHINLAVPAPAISKIIATYISTGDKRVLKFLDVQCAAVSQLWSLGLAPQSHL